MSRASEKKNYFTKHLFGAGVQCPTKLFYKAKNYPENRQAIPFIQHSVFNKRLLKSLLRSQYPEGIFIYGDSISESAGKTADLVDQPYSVLFNAIFECNQMMARLPIIVREAQEITVFQVQTKAFDSRRHRLTNSHGKIHGKWKKYLLDFAYQVYIVKQNYPELEIKPILVMPEKTATAHSGKLPYTLDPGNQGIRYDVKESNQELLAKIDVSELITHILQDRDFAEDNLPKPTFEKSLEYLRKLYLNSEKENPEVGLKCKNCEFRLSFQQIDDGEECGFNECWKGEIDSENPSKEHVFNLIGPGVNQWIENGIYEIQKIPDKDIVDLSTIVNGKGSLSNNLRQSLQIYKSRENSIPEEIIRPELFSELKRWEYPLHFLDFEAGNYAVPVRKNRSPYNLIIFQFSCHTLYANGEWEHHQWLDKREGKYPNYELVRELRKVSDIDEGTIVQYSNFERNALKTIRKELKEEFDEISDSGQLIKWIDALLRRNDSSSQKPPYIADLSRQVKNFYYNREMENSLSIKDVLSSVMSHCDYLKEKYSKPYSSENFDNIIWWQPDGRGGARNPYSILVETGDSPIRRGTEAMVIYGKMISRDISESENEAFRNALLKYCELDTLAMVMIYQHWKDRLQKNNR